MQAGSDINKAVNIKSADFSQKSTGEYHSISMERLLETLNTREISGLSSEERAMRLKSHGKNTLPESKKKGTIAVFLSQFADFMIFILFIAAGLSFYASYLAGKPDLSDPVVIMTILFINALIGTFQELRAEKSLSALKSCQSPAAWVVCNGKAIKVDAASLVPGDIIDLKQGDIVPADARIITSVSLLVDESALTGESIPVEKKADAVCSSASPLAERYNMLFSSTIISNGYATAVVTSTGVNTEIGKIASILKNNESPKTPLMLRMNKVSRVLGISCIAICLIIFGIGIYQKQPLLSMFMTSISLAVASIPEGLPVVVTIMLSIGVIRLSKQSCIIRNLASVETLGNVSIICSDKTGTLTQNKMSIAAFADTKGMMLVTPLKDKQPSFAGSDRLYAILRYAIPNCSGEPSRRDATEQAMTAMWDNLNLTTRRQNPGVVHNISAGEKLYEFPFNSNQKTMASVYRRGDTVKVYLKGAFDRIVPLCKKQHSNVNLFTDLHDKMSGSALRVICIAYKEISYTEFQRLYRYSDFYNSLIKDMTIYGLIGMIDPPRPEVRAAIAKASCAGIRTIMITGDHANTAAAIASKIGISSEKVISGTDIDKMSDDRLYEQVKSVSVFARVSPSHKVRLVKAFQKNGHRVVMTGDGINDAPALRCADIGAAMGINGTDVAKEAADMILADDNYATIVDAISVGRCIYKSISHSIHFLLSCNTGEILTVLFALLLGLPAPLAAIQLLWINLITDSLPAIALGMERPTNSAMSGKAHFYGDFDRLMIFKIILEGALIASVSLIAYQCYGSTGCFIVLGMSELMHSFNLRSDESVFKKKAANPFVVLSFILCSTMQLGIVFVPYFADMFKLKRMSMASTLVLLALSFVIILVSELEKAVLKRENV